MITLRTEGSKYAARRPFSALALVLVSVGYLVCGCGAGRALGSPQDELAALQHAIDVTINDANLKVVSRTPGTTDAACLGDGPPKMHATQTVTIDLGGENAEAISRRIADVWRTKTEEWFGGGLELDEGQVANTGLNRVTMGKGAWGLEAKVPYNQELGPYTINASSPCR